MRAALTATIILTVAAAFGQEPGVKRSAIWIDTVKRGDMVRQVRGLGVVANNGMVELKFAETQVREVEPGQKAAMDTGQGIVAGQVVRIHPGAVDGTTTVEVKPAENQSPGLRPGVEVDGAVQIGLLKDVTYVSRPVAASPGAEGTLFKLEPDGQHAVRVRVQYGQASINTLEVRNGIAAGDQVVVSDMSAFMGQDRVRLQ